MGILFIIKKYTFEETEIFIKKSINYYNKQDKDFLFSLTDSEKSEIFSLPNYSRIHEKIGNLYQFKKDT